MADYGSLFAGGGDNQFIKDSIASDTIKNYDFVGSGNEEVNSGLRNWFSNPENIKMLAFMAAKTGSSLSPKDSFGQKMGDAVTQMLSANAANRRIPSNAALGMPTPTTPITPEQPSTQLQTDNVLNSTKKFNSAIKMLSEVDPKVIGPNGAYISANMFNAKPVPSPTTPAVANGAPTAGVAPAPVAPTIPQNVGQLFSDAESYLFSPEQIIAANEQVNKNMKARPEAMYLESEAAYKNWQRSEQGQAFTLQHAVAPVLAQIDVLRATNQINVQNVNNLLSTKEGQALGAMKLPGGTTVGQQLLIAAASPQTSKNITDIIGHGLSYEATKYGADMHFRAAQSTAANNNDLKAFELKTKMFEKANADIAKWETAPTEESWKTMTAVDRMALAGRGITGPRTAELQQAINSAKVTRDKIGVELYGPSYNMIQKMENAVKPEKVITMDELRENKKKESKVKKLFNDDKGLWPVMQNSFGGGGYK